MTENNDQTSFCPENEIHETVIISENQSTFEIKPETFGAKSTEHTGSILQTILARPDRPFKCHECKRQLPTQEKLVQHIRRAHRGENAFQCYMCEYTTYNSTLFKEHTNRHKGHKPHKCTLCDFRTVSKKALKDHEKRHVKDTPLQCTQCSYIAMNVTTLNKHLEGHKKDNKTKEVKRSSKRLKNDRLKNDRCKKMKCHICKKMLANYNSLLKHTIDQHGAHNVLFKCEHCNWWSNQKNKVLLHLIHHPDQEVDEDIIDISILKRFKIMK